VPFAPHVTSLTGTSAICPSGLPIGDPSKDLNAPIRESQRHLCRRGSNFPFLDAWVGKKSLEGLERKKESIQTLNENCHLVIVRSLDCRTSLSWLWQDMHTTCLADCMHAWYSIDWGFLRRPKFGEKKGPKPCKKIQSHGIVLAMEKGACGGNCEFWIVPPAVPVTWD